MDFVIDIIRGIDIGNLIAMGLLLWFFYSRLDAKIERLTIDVGVDFEKMDKKFEQKIDNLEYKLTKKVDNVEYKLESLEAKLDQKLESLEKRLTDQFNKRFDGIEARLDRLESRIERLEGRFAELDKRIFGIEAILHMKDCCVLKPDGQLKKAE